MIRFLKSLRQWRFLRLMRQTQRLMLRDATLAELNKHIATAIRQRRKVSHLYRLYSERVDQILGGAR